MVEAAFFKYSKSYNQSEDNANIDSLEILIEKLLNTIASYETSVLELSENSHKDSDKAIISKLASVSQIEEEKPEIKLFTEEMLQSPNIPIYLKRKSDESHEEYMKRIKVFLEVRVITHL